MASIVRSRKKRFKPVYAIMPRCGAYDPHCFNCFRYKYLDHYGKFPDQEQVDSWIEAERFNY